MDDAWPEHLLASSHQGRQWRSRSEATWEDIRRDYLAGVAARDLCGRYDVALSTLRLKAREGGWRRADQADSDLFPADADRWAADEAADGDVAADHESWSDLADRARFRLRRAIGSGRSAEAASWLRVHDRLRVLAALEAEAGADVVPEPARGPDPIDAAIAVAGRIGSIARRAARAADDVEIEVLEAELEALEAHAATLAGPDAPDPDAALDSLDPVFSAPPPTESSPDRQTLLCTRERRLGLGLGVSDLDQALAALDRAGAGGGLSP